MKTIWLYLNIVEAPKNAALAILGASLGEDKYDRQKSKEPDKLGICASSKGVGNRFFSGVDGVEFLIC